MTDALSICDDCGVPVPQPEPIALLGGGFIEPRQQYCQACYVQRVFDYIRFVPRCPYKQPIARPKEVLR